MPHTRDDTHDRQLLAEMALDQLTGVPPQPVAPTPQVMAEAQAIEDVAMEAGLPAQTAGWLAQRSLCEAARRAPMTQSGAETVLLQTRGGV